MAKLLVIVPCGRGKIWDKEPQRGPTPARHAYTGAPFTVNRQYAERFGSAWCILSAKYGLIAPDSAIPANYNTTFNDATTNPVTVAHLQQQLLAQQLDQFDVIVGLGGKEYRAMVQRAFASTRAELVFPFAGLPIGKAMQATKHAIAEGTPFRK